MKILTALSISILLSASVVLARPVGDTPRDSDSPVERRYSAFYWNHRDRSEHEGPAGNSTAKRYWEFDWTHEKEHGLAKRDSKRSWHPAFWWNQPPSPDDDASSAVAKRAKHGTFWWRSEDVARKKHGTFWWRSENAE